MYAIDERDRVMLYDEFPAQSAGAPNPRMLADDHGLLVGYMLAPANEEWAIVEFARPIAHYFGPPNDETLASHPLYSRGLSCYGTFEILESSWIRGLEKANRVHPRYDAQRFEVLRHFVMTFHDGTFECIAISGRVVMRSRADAAANIAIEMAKRLPR
ncbi:MAG TPA: hypothetical protein VNV25_17945 [Gemmatimonadaceae bacterium]|jgi:hypothetical protein|nr:hypothetical protein [Gemmatimonadaceae bacterium]